VSWWLVGVVWWLLPGNKRWNAAASLAGLIHIAWIPSLWLTGRWVARRSAQGVQRRRAELFARHSVQWIEHVQIQTAAGLSIQNAMGEAGELFAQSHPDLAGYLPDSRWDVSEQCDWIARQDCVVWQQAGQGLVRLSRQGAPVAPWLEELIDRHFLALDERRQSAAAALGSKLLMPLIVGALPQAFAVIGFVVLNSSEGL